MKWVWSIGAAAFLILPQQLQSQQALPSTGRILVLWEPDAVSLPPGETEATADKVKVGKTKLRGIVNKNRVKLVRQLHKEWKASDVPLPYKVRARKKGDTIMPDELSDLSYWQVLEVTDTTRMAAMIDELNAAEGVVVAEPDGYIQLTVPRSPSTGLFARLSALLIPNDPSFGQQWGLYNPTNRAGDIRAPEAWDMQTGRTDTRIAILDTGLDRNNPDFAGGVVTTDHDFVNNDGDAYPDQHPKMGHGTSVAGIAAARTNEGVGAAGICGGSGPTLGCSILSAKILGNITWYNAVIMWLGNVSTAGPAVTWAVNSGAHVINNSWCADRGQFSINNNRSVHDAMRNAHGLGVLMVAAMGNSDGSCNMSQPSQSVAPAAWSDIVMSVGASTRSGTRVDLASGGNWQSGTGPHISVIAPGLGSYAPQLGGPPLGFSGTSAATPHVSGVAGLLRSESTARGLNLSSVDIRRIIEGTATDKDISGHDVNTGWGLINAEKALRTLRSPNQLAFVSLGPATSTCFAQLAITNWTFWAEWAVLQARRCELRRTVTFAKPYKTTPVVWGRPVANGGITPSNPNSQVFFTGVVPGTATTTGVTLRTYVYERWSLGGTYLGWYPVQPSQVNWAYGVAGEPAPATPFTVNPGVDGYVTVKATYPLVGSASQPAGAWRWDRDDDGFAYTLWANAQNSQYVAYAGKYTINWRLFARRNSDGVTDYGYASTTVCISTTQCGPVLAVAPVKPASASVGPAPSSAPTAPAPTPLGNPTRRNPVAGHFGAGPWISQDGDNAAVQFYSLAGRHDGGVTAGDWPNSFALTAGVPARRSAHRDTTTVSLAEVRQKPSPSVTTFRLASDRLKPGGSYRVSYAIDPDLGARPDDDQLTWIDSLGAVVVSDPDSGAIAYGWTASSNGTTVTLREYGNSVQLRDPETPQSAYREQRAESRALGEPGDVRFALTLGPVTPSAASRIQLSFVAAAGKTPGEALANLINERRRTPSAAELALDAGPSGSPRSFGLRQSLGRGGAASFSAGATEGATSLSARAQLRQFGITGLEYAVAEGQSADVQIRIYSRTGQLVRNLLREKKGPGEYYVGWDALNERGERVAPGVYIAVMEAASFKATRKLIITR